MTTRTFPLTAPINLVARIGHGSLRVDAREGLTEASVTITSRNDASVLDRVSVEMRGSTLV
ncbi:MAG: hypothetical protein QOG80_1980, partial [Pseudonocardiales bacterium]|nr:hypothetical protein [Pseudonocardiales bacterium]